jgi:tRNA threonylcarbamoyladenosine biosynthesis protein TsaB
VELLAIETATPTVSVAFGVDGCVKGEVNLGGGRRHAEQLVPAIEYLRDQTGSSFDRLAAIAVGTGPGLFTGLRVGVTTARLMAQTLRIPVIGVPTLDLVAYPLRQAKRQVVALIDARRREVFWARYQPVPGGLQRLGGYEVGAAEALAGDLEASREEVLLVGDGARTYRERFAHLDRVEIAEPMHDFPRAAALVELATAKYEREEFVRPDDLQPLYLRRSDAEIAWDRAQEPAW